MPDYMYRYKTTVNEKAPGSPLATSRTEVKEVLFHANNDDDAVGRLTEKQQLNPNARDFELFLRIL